MKYQLELTEEQLSVMCAAIEEYFRTSLGQWGEFADRLAAIGVDFSAKGREDRTFQRYIDRRSAVREVFECAGRILWPNRELLDEPRREIAIDMWRVIRHQQYLDSGSTDKLRVDAYPPSRTGSEPLMKIQKVEDEE